MSAVRAIRHDSWMKTLVRERDGFKYEIQWLIFAEGDAIIGCGFRVIGLSDNLFATYSDCFQGYVLDERDRTHILHDLASRGLGLAADDVKKFLSEWDAVWQAYLRSRRSAQPRTYRPSELRETEWGMEIVKKIEEAAGSFGRIPEAVAAEGDDGR